MFPFLLSAHGCPKQLGKLPVREPRVLANGGNRRHIDRPAMFTSLDFTDPLKDFMSTAYDSVRNGIS